MVGISAFMQRIGLFGINGELYARPERPAFDAMIAHPLCLHSVDEIFDRSASSWLEAWNPFPRIVQRYCREKETPGLQTAIGARDVTLASLCSSRQAAPTPR